MILRNHHLHLLPGMLGTKEFGKSLKVVVCDRPRLIINQRAVIGVIFGIQLNIGKLRRTDGGKDGIDNYSWFVEPHRDY